MSRAPLSRRDQERAARVLSALAACGGRLEYGGEGADCRYRLAAPGETAPRLAADAALVERMAANDWLSRAGAAFVLGEAGRAWLRRLKSANDPWRAQHLATETAEIVAPDGRRAPATVVANESPLAWLRRRRGADGRPLVSATQYVAGERLRADFERGRLGPRVTVDWTGVPAGRRRRGAGGGPADIADSALAARRRVDAAMRALGPDLGALLIDVCCFLTGLEDAERGRAWPRRSAKVVLAIALDRLAAHYGLSESARGHARSRAILHWGDPDYRPKIDAAPEALS